MPVQQLDPRLKAPPLAALDLSLPTPDHATKPPAESAVLLLESLLHSRPTAPAASLPKQPVLLTCPSYFFIETYLLTPMHAAPVCARCMRRFQRQEREGRDRDGFINFPRLLEEHAVVRDSRDSDERYKRDERGSVGYGAGLGGVVRSVVGIGRGERAGSSRYIKNQRSDSSTIDEGSGYVWSI
jgi:hypothetical protein